MFFGRKKESAEEKEARLRQARAEIQVFLDDGKYEYDEICEKTRAVLASSGKPVNCSTVRFASEPYFFPDLNSYQVFFTDWEIWTHANNLYIYRSEVTDYPENYAEADAPAIVQIPLSEIRYFRVEGAVTAEIKVSGGKVSQNRYTGRIHQTAIKTKTEQHDSRVVRMCAMNNGTIKTVDFEYSAYDVLRALLPEKIQ